MKLFKKILVSLAIILTLLLGVIAYFMHNDRQDKYSFDVYDETLIPTFKELQHDFVHQFDQKNSLPLVASAMIDIDNDGTEEIFLGGGAGQNDRFYRFKNETLVDITNELEWQKDKRQNSLGAAVIDLDGDTLTDMLIARESQVLFYKNLGGKFASPKDLGLKFNEDSEPVGLALADINKDGFVDLFVSTYLKKNKMEGQTIFNKEGYGSRSELFLNNGDNTFKNFTDAAGLAYIHNTFVAVFVDLNNDSNADLVVAHDTGEPRIYKNNGNLTFTLKPNPFTGSFSYPMGIAIGDYDNNGLQDIFFSNIGSSMPNFAVRGDLRKDQKLFTELILLKNNGDFNFTQAAPDAKVDKYEFSWGAVFEDFNLDGRQDLIIAENYVDLPNSKIMPLPGRFLMQLPNHTFTNVEKKNHTVNPSYAISPVQGDINGDGWPDILLTNLSGTSKIFLNKATNKSNYLKVQIPVSTKYLNAKISILKNSGEKMTLQRVNAEGLSSDGSPHLYFGLGSDTSIQKMELELTEGFKTEIPVSGVNQTIKLY